MEKVRQKEREYQLFWLQQSFISPDDYSNGSLIFFEGAKNERTVSPKQMQGKFEEITNLSDAFGGAS